MKDHILIADDDQDVISSLRYLLESEGYEVSAASSPAEAKKYIEAHNFNMLLMDLNYTQDTTSGAEGLQLLSQVKEIDELIPIVVMTAWGSIETAVEAMQKGARDFVQKPWENGRLLSIVENQLRLQKAEQQTLKLEEENQLLRDELQPLPQELISASPAMNELLQKLERAAKSDANILLTGENGTGKSFLVKHVHAMSSRSQSPLISVNMGSITETLFESEMFGHIKGAFTDARENRIGRFELAAGGTLFLDEIGTTPVSQQAKLLRVLEEHKFEKVGSARTQDSDCRLVCATNTDLEAAIEAGSFRKDLLYRINTITLEVPPLRHRREDIVPLASSFLHTLGEHYRKPGIAFSNAARQALQAYSWPGNIRELSHVVERATILCSGNKIESAELALTSNDMDSTASDTDDKRSLDQVIRSVISQRIQSCHGNRLDAAKSLGLSKSAFYRQVKKYDL